MEYEKIMNLLDKTPNQPCKVRTKNWVEINDDGINNTQINNTKDLDVMMPMCN